jgi:hypothetical protein
LRGLEVLGSGIRGLEFIRFQVSGAREQKAEGRRQKTEAIKLGGEKAGKLRGCEVENAHRVRHPPSTMNTLTHA